MHLSSSFCCNCALEAAIQRHAMVIQERLLLKEKQKRKRVDDIIELVPPCPTVESAYKAGTLVSKNPSIQFLSNNDYI